MSLLTLKNKVIGLHTGGNSINNHGTFLNEPIKDFIKEYNNKKQSDIIKYNSKIANSKYLKQDEEINGL